ncbi:sigma-54 specific flagellar transcriptional regulator A [Litorivivens lipolytica]|uniref:Sigma-54 specific flagellar transcriptional regulator A n=1 Tax=Litorivivens lipolytica TaxID=1524264 RepID=A0A7W4Z5Y2_9GAMM|nr:sigma-54 dependent transcriptional regulator [Litorivivens lipolytica]MBB3046370.1 sigma-54 specific flagellar transcriptional regulator A [Litorivivens lipolytica]
MAGSTVKVSYIHADRGPLGRSEAQRSVRELIDQVAAFDTLVLIQGESGSGKEVVARSIHNTSNRKDKPFVPVNCGAIPPDLLESELFGHEKGAFTGAITARKGRFEMAEGGTLFLDEIGDMSFNMQVKLLRVLQERCFERVGSNQTIQCNVRILAATHRDLGAMIEAGTFRHDLFYRLNVFPITVPPLREHLSDLPELVTHFLDRFKEKGMVTPRFTKTALEALQGYHWPGNVRELENILERLSITHGGRLVSARDLPCPIGSPLASEETAEEISFLLGNSNDEDEEVLENEASDPVLDLPEEGFDLKAHIQALEKQFIVQALERANGTVTQAAKLLGLQRTTLAEKMKKLQMT